MGSTTRLDLMDTLRPWQEMERLLRTARLQPPPAAAAARYPQPPPARPPRAPEQPPLLCPPASTSPHSLHRSSPFFSPRSPQRSTRSWLLSKPSVKISD